MYWNVDTANRRVLIVEKHDGFRHLMGAFLSRKFDVVEAANGLDAMLIMSKGLVPDAIILDAGISGPGLDSEMILSNLRCSGLYHNLPVIVICNQDDANREQRFRQLGANALLRKPFNPERLQEILDKTVRLSLLNDKQSRSPQ